jgi:hypothetical protein
MLLLLSLVLLRYIKIKFRQRETGIVFAVPAYVAKKRIPHLRRIPLPKDIPIVYL